MSLRKRVLNVTHCMGMGAVQSRLTCTILYCRSVGMPRLEMVQLTNPSSSHVIHLNSISGDSPVFHASFFKSKVVKPGESTTFDVVFLARAVGAVHNTLYIHTSMGTFDYRVRMYACTYVHIDAICSW